MILSTSSGKPNYLFGSLPDYFKANDSYVPTNSSYITEEDSGLYIIEEDTGQYIIDESAGAGLLERYLECFCNELDEELLPRIDDLGLLFNAIGLPEGDYNKFLDIISNTLGNPPDIGSEAVYKILLRYLIYILQTKGTRTALDLYLALYGYKVYSITVTPFDKSIYDKSPTPLKFDSGHIFDSINIFYFNAEIEITDYDFSLVAPTSAFLLRLKEALGNFILPIYTNLTALTYRPSYV